MKRLFGLIGLTYLSVLTAVYYLSSEAVLRIIAGLSVGAVVVGILLIIFKKLVNINKALLTVGITALCACVAITLFTGCCYTPLVEEYSDKELKITGYISDEVQKSESSATYTIQTETVNGKEQRLKLQLVSYTLLDAEAFDCIEAELTMYRAGGNSLISNGIFFKAYASDGLRIQATGEKHSSLYSLAVSVRKAMKSSLDLLLPEDYSSLCKAVLLGDKSSLSCDVYSSFTNTGTSFLIVVSGMHLAVVASFILFLLKKITKNRFVLAFSVFAVALSFMAVTGFHFSVVRAGVMLIIAYGATLAFRRSDPLNSLGAAALVLTLPNPYAVGDIGLILSFTATLGIILWSGKIYSFVISKLELKSRVLKSVVNLVSVSISAALWIIPITTLAFGRVSVYVVIISVLTEPAVSVLIVCALFASMLYLLPFFGFAAYPFALVCGLLSKYILLIISAFSSLPYPYIKSDKPYFYVWIAITVLLVIVGYFIKAKGFYVGSAIAFSFVSFTACCLVASFVADSVSTMTIYNVGSGITAAVKSGGNISLISCGGTAAKREDVTGDIGEEYFAVDYIIIPNSKNKYSSFQSELINEFDVSDVLLYDSDSTDNDFLSEYDGQSRRAFGDNVEFTVNLTSTVTDTVLNIDGITYQLVKGNNASLLFVPSGGDIAALPEEYRTADYLLIDSIPDNPQLLDCDTLIYSETEKKFTENYSSLKEICSNIISVSNGKTEINL